MSYMHQGQGMTEALGKHTARPDFAELDVFLGQHMSLTLEQHFNPKM